MRLTSEQIGQCIGMIAAEIHQRNLEAGWWSDLETGERKERNVGEMLCLVHSEISEAMEGSRKNLMDDKLPARKMFEVELIDAQIRLFDILGSHLCEDPAGAMQDKLEFNRVRPDHKRESRLAEGGKAY